MLEGRVNTRGGEKIKKEKERECVRRSVRRKRDEACERKKKVDKQGHEETGTRKEKVDCECK